MIRRFLKKIGVDRAIFYTSVARVFQGFGGIITVTLVATYLTGVEQGFYYTFASILAIQIFFELGLGGIITQYVAHEKAHLEERDGVLTGSEEHKSRLAYLLRFCVRWYSVLAIVLFVVITIVGFVFFGYFYNSEEVVNWHTPWLLLVLGTSLNFILAPISAYIEGLGKIAEIAKIRLVQQIASQILVWGGLISGFKLFVVILAPYAGALILLILGWYKFKYLLTDIMKTTITTIVSYKKEIFPYQWRIALSWISGYFIFQLFNPVLFATEGAVVAGQMGMTLAIITAIQGLGLSWIVTKVPIFSSMIALKDYTQLDSLFNKTVKQMLLLVLAALLFVIAGVYVIGHLGITLKGVPISQRLLPIIPMLLMMGAMYINIYIAAIATYLRCHKQEPFLVNSIVGGVLCMLSTVMLGKYFGVMGVTIGYFFVTLCLLPWSYSIYKIKKVSWH